MFSLNFGLPGPAPCHQEDPGARPEAAGLVLGRRDLRGQGGGPGEGDGPAGGGGAGQGPGPVNHLHLALQPEDQGLVPPGRGGAVRGAGCQECYHYVSH